MGKIKEMPYEEKYAIVLDNINDPFALLFVKERLGKQTADELETIWAEGIKPIAENASSKEKYEAAYSNWIWKSKNNLKFIRDHLCDDGIELFKRAEVEALKRNNSGPALVMLDIIRRLSPGAAFNMVATKMAYQLQWITPFRISEISRARAIFDIPSCKILGFPGTDDICRVGCQGAYPAWLAEQFKVKMAFQPHGKSCTCTVTPIK